MGSLETIKSGWKLEKSPYLAKKCFLGNDTQGNSLYSENGAFVLLVNFGYEPILGHHRQQLKDDLISGKKSLKIKLSDEVY